MIVTLIDFESLGRIPYAVLHNSDIVGRKVGPNRVDAAKMELLESIKQQAFSMGKRYPV